MNELAVQALTIFLTAFTGCMGWLLVLERFPRLQRLYGKRHARLSREVDELGAKLGRELHERVSFGVMLLTSAICAMAGTLLYVLVEG